MSDTVNLVDVFRRHFPENFSCVTFDEFQRKLRIFQRETGTSYVKRSVCTRAKWYRQSGKVIPEAVKYKHFYLSCIHCAKKGCVNDGKNHRFQDYQCPSVIHVAYKNDALRISHSYMVHNHRIMDADPGVYPGNRRLEKCEEELLYSIMDSLPRTRDVIEFAQHEFDVVLTAIDVRDIRQRKRARAHTDEPVGIMRTLPPEYTEDDSSKAECLSQDQVDYKTEARHVVSDLCEVMCNLETKTCEHVTQELKKVINFIALGVNFVVEPVENCYATTPIPNSGLTEICQPSASNV
ncbi:hypothetical protein AHF37_11657 [Paragonimus kellicotti]|nr:hypothetical protein AHF37_11657 [Paragonimus kellicotti]